MRFSIDPLVAGVIRITLLAAILAPTAAVGQVVPPVPLEQPQPEPPSNRFGMPIEGWAIVRYSVLADGTTANVRVIDHMPAQLSERELRQTVETWTFEPAISDGMGVEWHNNESVIVFDADTIPYEPSPMFVRDYREVEALLADGENEDAFRRSERLIAMEMSRLAEMGVALVQNARVHLSLGDSQAAYAAIRRATDPRISLLDPSELIVALDFRNRLELTLGDVVGALETLSRRNELEPVPESDPVASRAAAIESAINGDAAIAVQGKILDNAWWHDLERRTFAIGDLEGDLRDVLVECDRGTTELEFSVESEWTLPESWGACVVAVDGRRDTRFTLYEFR